MNVTMEEARSSLPELLERMTAGEEVVIARDAKPVARLVAPETVPFRKRVRLTGRLAEIDADRQSFTLQLTDGNCVRGLLKSSSIDELSALIDKSIVIDGVASYGAPGNMCVETKAFRSATEADAFFARLPSPPPHWIDLQEMSRRNAAALRESFGKWPGDETDAAILAALKKMG